MEAFNEFGEELELEQKKENSSNMEYNVITLPIEFMANQNISEDEEHSSKSSNAQGACHILLTDEEMENLEPKVEPKLEFPLGKIIFEKPSKRMSQHLKPLFIKVHMDGIPINRVLVDNGAAINILPWGMLKKNQ